MPIEVIPVRVSAEVAGIVMPGGLAADNLAVVAGATALDGPMASAAAAARAAVEAADVTAAVRTMFKRTGVDPTKTRPSSEALLRRVRRGDPLPRVNNLVDVVNWCSLETQLPYGVYDMARVRGTFELRLGMPGEQYPGIRKDAVHLGGRLALVDEEGPFGNPTSDSARTMVTTATTRALIVIFAPRQIAAARLGPALDLTRDRVERYCARL